MSNTNNLGNVVGQLRRVTPPDEKKYVIWARVIDPANPNRVILNVWDEDQQLWVPLTEPKHWWDPVTSITNTPPDSPTNGDRYIVGTAPTAEWATQENQLVEYVYDQWEFRTPSENVIIYNAEKKGFYAFDGTEWESVGKTEFDGNRAITLNISGLAGKVPGGSTPEEWIENLFYAAEAPVAAISGGTTKQFGADPTITINWSVTKKTRPITSITVAGQVITPTGNSQSGSLQVDATQNVNTTFSIVVSDGTLTDTKNTTVVWANRRFWFLADDFTITDELIQSAPGGGSDFSATRLQTLNNFGGGSKRPAFAWRSNLGTPTFKVNSLVNTAFTKVRDNQPFVNSDGYSANYDVWVYNFNLNSPANIEVL
jgi:hypothetical protein